MDFILNNWEWIMIGYFVLEKVIRATPTKIDDITFDMILVPIKNELLKRFNIKKEDKTNEKKSV